MQQRIAIIGSGIAGLGAAWLLEGAHDITVFEAAARAGGHTNTVMAGDQPVDTGFIVYNDRNYPRFRALLGALDVAGQASDMSFAVSIGGGALEWAGDNWRTLFAQKRLLASVSHWHMLTDVVRFNRQAKRLLDSDAALSSDLGAFLDRHGYGQAFRSRYLLPMAAAIWSAPARFMLDFPVASFLRFFDNHGLLDLTDRPQWYTVAGGSHRYVQAIADVLGERLRLSSAVTSVTRKPEGVWLRFRDGTTRLYDQVIFACHADTSLQLLADATAQERQLLGAFRFQPNRAVLHGDTRLMPRRKSVWSSWNYMADHDDLGTQQVSVTYWQNRLQSIDSAHDYFVSLNPLTEPEPGKVIREIEYGHPVFDSAAINAQRALPSMQGVNRSWYCGAWCGYGFHEDGLAAAERVAAGLGVAPPWGEIA